jgi:transcriptional regulator with XRE-family HTH domain
MKLTSAAQINPRMQGCIYFMEQYEQWLKDFGARLRAERERQGLTRAALAERIDTKQDYIAQLERGNKAPSMRTILNILSTLNVTPDYLMASPHMNNDERERTLERFTVFLKQLDTKIVSDLFEIVKFLERYV